MEALNDDTVIDSINLNSSSGHSKPASSHGRRGHRGQDNGQSRKSKRLPWNCEVIRDRFTPQPYSVQLVQRYLEVDGDSPSDVIILAQNPLLNEYLVLTALQLHKQKQINRGTKRLSVLATHMTSNVSSLVDLISRHTTLKLAGIDQTPLAGHTESLSFYGNLKNDADLIIISVNHLLEWFQLGLVTPNDISLIVFDFVTAVFHMRDVYERLMGVLDRRDTRILGFGSLTIDWLDDVGSVRDHIEQLKTVFGCGVVETATDLLDTYNIFNGFEPTEVVEICDDAVSASQIHDFNLKLVQRIKTTFVFFEHLIATSTDHSSTYIHQLCLRVLNECVYLLNEVGVWCLAKSLLPFICQIDKLAAYIDNKETNEDTDPNHLEASSQQILTLQSTSTLLRELREMCIKQILHYKSTSHRNTSFLANFTTPKVQRLVQLLKSYKGESFCGVIFVQNKQVATSLSLLLKKLAKEDHHSLGFVSPNYIIGNQQANEPTPDTDQPTESSNSSIKQEEILKKFYSGEVNLLICTCEMERSIESPSFVNLIVRFNCTSAHSAGSSSACFDYFSYIETKTRAKSKQACCHFFVEQSHFPKFLSQINRYKQIESQLINNYSRLVDFNKPILPPTNPSSSNSKLTLENCVFLINRYCIRLPSDALTQLTPRYDIHTETDADGRQRFRCELRMPINSGMHESVASEWESSERMAKATAAFNTLLELYERNEINEFLEPITKEMFYKYIHRADEDDIREWSQFNQKNPGSTISMGDLSCYSSYMAHRPGGNKRKQIYQRKISPYLESFQVISTQIPAYIYAIKLTLATPICINNHERPEYSPSTTFGLIVSRPLLEIVDFPIYTANGEEIVHIELVKSNVYFTPNQMKLVKTFHKFVFSNVLRMEGRGAAASPFLSNPSTCNSKSMGCLICVLLEADDNKMDVDWALMKSVDGCTDKSFMRQPEYAKRVVELDSEENEDDSAPKPTAEFKFDRDRFTDSVVVPFYRNDSTPQFYCVTSIDDTLTPESPFPSSTHSNKPSSYSNFIHYFGYKYNIQITDPLQPLLVVTHPSTRLNLLTPRYMNMKASVLQKSTIVNPNRTAGKKGSSGAGSSSNQIYLVPELVNVHPLKASVWKRCMCLPSILFRLNSLLLAEELRREIASGTGVGVPWVDNHATKVGFFQGFDRLEFEWDAGKELEMSTVPDVEIDLATIEHKKKQESQHPTQSTDSWSSREAVTDSGVDSGADSGWNFEISVWDENCLKEIKDSGKNSSQQKPMPGSMFSFVANLPEDFLKPTCVDPNPSGWNDFTNSKTLFIDPNDMDLFADEFIDSEDELQMMNDKFIDLKTVNPVMAPTDNLADSNSENESGSEDESPKGEHSKFTIDINNLKTDMKRKSAKLLSKLSVGSNACLMLRQLVDELNLVERSASDSDAVKYAAEVANSTSVKINLDAVDYKCFENVQFRCESRNIELNSLVGELRNRLVAAKCRISAESTPVMAAKTVSLPLKKKEMSVLGDWSNKHLESSQNPSNDSRADPPICSLRNTNWSFNFSLDDQSNPNELGPGPAILLQALTLSNAGDGFDLERLETVGDSFLKQAITVYLFFTYPNVNEGKLSFLRSKQVSNYNLYKLGKRKGLQELIVSAKFEPLESWLPPHYCSSTSLNSNGFLFSGASSTSRFDKYRDHCISDKSIADCVEAIIGAYLITSGPQAALKVMSWFGLEVLPKVRCEDENSTHQVLVPLPHVQEPPRVLSPAKLGQLLVGLEQFEATIGYKFRHPVYLVQAFTHASYTDNTITDCYQRLEFLGDAILDYVITRYLFECREYRLSPGELTDLRSSLVNNNIFAYLAVKFDFYKYFKYTSPQIFTIVDSFVQNQKKRCDEFELDEDLIDFPIDDDDEEDYLAIEETGSSNEPFFKMQPQPNELEELEVPKYLGDVFESVAGAIYLDSNRSLDTVWRVYYGLMKPYIEKFTAKVPKSPIRELLELEPETVKFEKPERTIDGKIRVTVVVLGKGKFKGVGRNYRIAKNAAAKMALKFLKNQNQE